MPPPAANEAPAPGAAGTPPAHHALVIAPQWIGDAVMSQPLMARLAARGEHLTVAALPWVAPVYRAMPEVAEVVALPFQHGRLDWGPRRALGRQWRGRFTVAYVLPNSIKSALLPWLARVPRRVGYHGEGRWILLTERRPNPTGRPPMVAFYEALADGAGRHPPPSGHTCHHTPSPDGAGHRPPPGDTARTPPPGDTPPDALPRLVLPAGRIAQAAGQARLEPGRYWVFAPGAEYGPAKRWPVSHYAALARALQTARGTQAPLPVVLLGSAKEAALCEQIAAQAPPGCRVLAGQTRLDEAIALIAGARGMVSNDSGLMHVAAAFGLPQVAVFGSTSPEHTPPHNPRATVLWLKDELQLDCMPCFERECRYGHLRCLTEVAPTRVEQALRAQVAGACGHFEA